MFKKLKFSRAFLPPLPVLLVLLFLTILIWQYSKYRNYYESKIRFENSVQEATNLIVGRLGIYTDMLSAAKGLFNSSIYVEREEFARYSQSLDLKKKYPGTAILLFVRRVKEEEREAFIRKIKYDLNIVRLSDREFKIFPAREREEYFVVDYIEPYFGNEQIHGFDLFTEGECRKAMAQARDSGTAISTARMKLLGSAEKDYGFLVFLPVYSNEASIRSLEERKRALSGFIAGVFNTNDLFNGIFQFKPVHPDLDFEVFDSQVYDAEHLLYDENPSKLSALTEAKGFFKKVDTFVFVGRNWNLSFVAPESFGLSLVEKQLPLYILLSGIIFSLLLSAIFAAISLSRSRAIVLAAKLTEDLRQANDGLEANVATRTKELKNNMEELQLEFNKRKQTEERLRITNRALLALSACNQAMIRADNELSLLGEVCRILAHVGGYSLAWVGFPQQDKGKSVLPVAQVGYEKGYLESIKVTWDDSESGKGPVGTAIRTGKVSIITNILTNPDFSPWRSEASKRGYASVIGLPLIANTQILGALAIYSKEPDAFDPEEVKLLTELADDLAFGISALRINLARQRAQAALEESHNRLNLFLNSAAEGIYVIDLEGNTAFINQAALANTGYKQEEVLGHRNHDIFHHTQTDGSAYAIEKCPIFKLLKDGSTYNVSEEVFWKKDGTSFPVEYICAPIKEEGKITGAVVIFQDITQRKLSESSLKKAKEELEAKISERTTDLQKVNKQLGVELAERKLTEEKVKQIANEWETTFNTITDLVAIHDKDFKIVKVNKAYADFLKLKPQELIGRTCYKEMHGTEAPLPSCPHKKAIERKKPFSEEIYDARSGMYLEVSASPIFNEKKEVIASVHITKDITSRKQMENDLKENEERLRIILDSIPTGVVLIDAERRVIVNVNPVFLEMIGAAKEQIIGQMAHKFIYTAGVTQSPAAKAGDGIEKSEGMLLKVDGGKLPVIKTEVSVILGGRKYLLQSFMDISTRKHIEELKDEFISTVSHELRTPLSITKEGINLIIDKIPGEVNEKQSKILVTARDNIDRLARIINDLLDISKIEAGKIELKKELIGTSGLIKQVCSTFEAKAKVKGLKLKIALPAQDIAVYADKDKLIQVFTNLIGNAVKFTPQGFIEIAAGESENKFVCTISDTGPGISEEDLPRVFSKFQQFGRTAGPGEKGTGLGLSIVKGIVEMQGGEIWVESQLGKGAKFTFTLPKYNADALIKERINNGLKDFKENGIKSSLILVSIGVDKSAQDFSKEKIDLLLKDLAKVLKDNLHRADDVILKDAANLVLILSGCDKESALSVEDRLKGVVEEYFTRNDLSAKIKLDFNSVTFPDEGSSEEELIKKVQQKVTIIRTAVSENKIVGDGKEKQPS